MKRFMLPYTILFVSIIAGCGNMTENKNGNSIEIKTPVTITKVEYINMSERITLSATSSYLIKNQVNSNITGYIEKSMARVGEFIQAGQPLFFIRTKEAEALKKFHAADSSFNVSGLMVIKAPESGILTQVNKFVNDYINDGDVLAIIAKQSSLVFLLNIPFELKKYAAVGTNCLVVLPDSTRLDGRVTLQLSTVDPVSQTQLFEVRVPLKQSLPENLVASVLLVKSMKTNTQVVDRSCVLSDEIMENFWVMKLLNDTTAIKVPVTKGISSENKIEIVSPVFKPNDRILFTGQYGLPDTAFVMINK